MNQILKLFGFLFKNHIVCKSWKIKIVELTINVLVITYFRIFHVTWNFLNPMSSIYGELENYNNYFLDNYKL
jgi:hypothetical protein